LKNVTIRYDDVTILDNISFSLPQNEFLGIIGPNGGGKTTLLKTILGLVKPETGMIKILGMDPVDARKFMGYVPQYSNVDSAFPINVWDVTMMGRLGKKGLLKRYDDHDRESVRAALERVGMLDQKHQQFGTLSGGQKQRVLIARALASEPKILLLDEPTASVDTEMEKSLYDILKSLKETVTIVLVSHDIGAVSSNVDTVACLNRKLFYHGSDEVTSDILEETYMCPVEMIAHGVPHRVLKTHSGGK
jgi:zinc transport system ATP-binding protein